MPARKKAERPEPRLVETSYRDIDTGEPTNVPESIQRLERGLDKVTSLTVNLGGVGLEFKPALTDPSAGLTADDLRGAGIEVPADLEARARGAETLAGWTREAGKLGMSDIADAFANLERQYAADVARQYPSPSAASSVLPDMQTTEAPTSTLPAWTRQVFNDWRGGVAHAFLLVGPNDYVDSGLDASDYLAYQLADPKGINLRVVMRYSVDQGITFLQPGMREIFDRVLGLGGGAQTEQGLMLDRTRQLLSEVAGQDMDIAFEQPDGSLRTGQQIKAANRPPLPTTPTEATELVLRFLRTVRACECGMVGSDDQLAEHLGNELRSALLAGGFSDQQIGRFTNLGAQAMPAGERDRLVAIGASVENLHSEAQRPTSAIVMERLDLMLPPSDKAIMQPPYRALLGALTRAGTDLELERQGNPIIMLAPSPEEVHPDVRAASSGIRMVEIPPASYDDRLRFIRQIAEKYPTVKLEMSPERMAGMTSSLFRRHIEDLFLRAKAAAEEANEEYGLLSFTLLKERKAEIMASEFGGMLEERELDHSLGAIGGHTEVVAYLRDYVIQVLNEGWVEDAPKGILQSGPSGTGKTFTADAVAAELEGWSCFELKPEEIRGKWQGETEKLWARCAQGIVGGAPCVVLVDEAERQFRESGDAGGGNNSAEENLIGGMLRLMGREDIRGKVLFVFNCNFPNRLPAALKRPGRIDIKLAFLPPKTAAARADTFSAVLEAQRRPSPSPEALLRLGAATEGWTQAEIKNAVIKAGRLMRVKGMAFLEALDKSVASLKPATQQIKLMTDLAIAECDDEELLPPEYRSQLADREQLEERIATAEERLEPRERQRGSRRVGRF